MRLLSELRRRNVFRVASGYAVFGWLLIEIADTIFPYLNMPEWTVTLVIVLLLAGLPLVLIISWIFDLTPDGLIRTAEVSAESDQQVIRGRELDFIIIVVLLLLLSLLLWDKFNPQRSPFSALAATPSIAILPFTDLSEQSDQAYFADGLSEEILNLLAHIDALQVTARTSSFAVRDKGMTVPEIGATLGVSYLLEGTVRKAGNQLRISTKLISAKDGFDVWTASFDRTMSEVFAIQDEIAMNVVEALKLKLLDDVPAVRTTNAEAYQLFLQGRKLAAERNEESLRNAEQLLQQTLEIDSSYVPALVELSDVYVNQANVSMLSFDDAFASARSLLEQAISIDPDYGPAHAQLGRIRLYYDWNLAAADAAIQQALKLDSGDARIINNAAALASNRGRLQEAVDLYQRAIKLDPIRHNLYINLALTHYKLQQLDAALSAVDKALALSPDAYGVHFAKSRILLARGDAVAALSQASEEKADWWRLQGQALALHDLGQYEAAASALQRMIERHADGWAYQIAETHAYMGDTEQAFVWLQRAYDNRDGGLIEMLTDPLLQNLHSDPRWQAFINKMGFNASTSLVFVSPAALTQPGLRLTSSVDAVAETAPAPH